MSNGARDVGLVQPSVAVRGEAAIRTEPDEAIVWITLSAVHPTPGSALADVGSRRRWSSIPATADEGTEYEH